MIHQDLKGVSQNYGLTTVTRLVNFFGFNLDDLSITILTDRSPNQKSQSPFLYGRDLIGYERNCQILLATPLSQPSKPKIEITFERGSFEEEIASTCWQVAVFYEYMGLMVFRKTNLTSQRVRIPVSQVEAHYESPLCAFLKPKNLRADKIRRRMGFGWKESNLRNILPDELFFVSRG